MLLICMHTNNGIHMLIMLTHMILCILMCTLVHIVDVRATLQNFAMIEYIIQILQISLFGLGNVLTPMDPKRYGYQNSPLLYLSRCGLSLDVRVLVPWWWMRLRLMDTTLDASPSRMFGGRTTMVWRPSDEPKSLSKKPLFSLAQPQNRLYIGSIGYNRP